MVGLKEDLVECATVCVKSEVILLQMGDRKLSLPNKFSFLYISVLWVKEFLSIK